MNDQTAAPNFEITASLAEEAEELLRDFAEDAELDVALIVDHSGGLIAGITADEEIQIETVGALVAGAVGSVKALGKSVGETNPVESINHGTDNTIYLRQLSDRFIIVGIAEAELPSGIIREKAAQIADSVLGLLTGEAILEVEDAEEKDAEDGETEESVEDASPFNLTDISEDEELVDEEPDDEVEAEIELGDPEEDEAPSSEDEEIVVPPLVVDSPFEIAMEGEDDDEVEASDDSADEEEEEGAFPAGETFFELGGVDSSDEEEDSEVVIGAEAEEEVEADDDFEPESENTDDDDDDEDAVSVPPLLIEPAMPTAAEVARRLEEDATTSIAAISTPIATGITRKEETPPVAPVSEKDAEEDADFEDTDDDDEPVGGPRYVFEIG